jgi:hypothetical protein
MKTWREFLQSVTKPLDEHEIDGVYDKSKISVEIVRWYNPRLLDAVNTIANLTSGVYGIFNSGETQRQLPPDVEKNLLYYGRVTKNNVQNVPRKALQQYYPDLKDDQIKDSYTIRVNVRRILRESRSEFEAVVQIASTIIHEATHKGDFAATGNAGEPNAYGAEGKFMSWVQRNVNQIIQKYPQLRPQDVEGETQVKPRH